MSDKIYEVRLECLKLANGAGREIEEILARAKRYENYILEETKKAHENLRKESNKKVQSEGRELLK